MQVDGLRKSHEKRLSDLRSLIRFAEEEAALHEALLELAKNDRLLEILDRRYADTEFAAEFDADPRACLEREQIDLPEGVELIRTGEDSSSAPRLAAMVYRGPWEVRVEWDDDSGFSVRIDTRRLRQFPSPVSYFDDSTVDERSFA
jgi:hypothetical protein